MSNKNTGSNNDNYRLTIHGKNLEVTEAIKDYISDKISKVEALSTDIIDFKVLMDIQKLDHIVELHMKFSHFRVNVKASTKDIYSAIDKAFDKLENKLRKWKGRIQDHHQKALGVLEMEVNVLDQIKESSNNLIDEIIDANNDSLEDPFQMPKVIKKKKRPLKTLNMNEAVMKMELSNDHFKVYLSEEDKSMKIIYRRRNGSYGIISPS